jgi:biotin synthase
MEALCAAAARVKLAEVGSHVYLRGIIEFSNRCNKDCYYCGIRSSNGGVDRFRMSSAEIVASAEWAWRQRYGSIVLQSGELQSAEFRDFVTGVLEKIAERTGGELAITLSLGEQDQETYGRWFSAGAHRYLLRIETSDPGLYTRLHPGSHRFEERVACLDALRETGYQVGTGVMIGLPGQTVEQLARDIGFCRERDIDMIGMGPYIPHADTPLGCCAGGWDAAVRRQRLDLSLRMIALTRLMLRDVNIAATTALQALDPEGREKGLLAGANVIMPNVTDARYRSRYQLYEGKPCLDEDPLACATCLTRRIERVGGVVGFGAWGDSPHFARRMNRAIPASIRVPVRHTGS